MILATAAVAVVPICVVWFLRDRGAISSAWVGVLVAVALSLLVSFIGSAYWKRHRDSEDLMFSELLLWGWVRRLYVDRQVERATKGLTLARPRQQARVDPRTRRQRERLLIQLATALETQDPYLKGHSRRVARHATMIARKMRLRGDEVARIGLAGSLHDVGKLSVPPALLNKRGKLTAPEFEVVKRHAEVGAEMVACLGDPELTAMVRYHHERLDGTGYPGGLREGQIPLGARVVAVADTYDAITASRPYRPASPHKQAFDTLRAESMAHLDPAVVRALVACYSGRRALAFWEALVAWPQGALAASGGGTGVITPRRSVRELVGTTVTTIAIAAAAIAAPIAVQQRAHRAATPPPAAAPARFPGIPHQAAALQPRHSLEAVATHASASLRSSGRALRVHVTRHTGPTAAHARRGTSATHTTGVTSPNRPTRRRAPAPSKSAPATHRGNPPAAVLPAPTGGRPSQTTPTTPTTPTGPTAATPPTTTPPSTNPVLPAGPPAAVPPPVSTGTPVSKEQCKKGGYASYGFSNQGQCVASVEHHG